MEANQSLADAKSDDLWSAPRAYRRLDATVIIPGSKSLSNRYLILAALGNNPVRLEGLLRSRDTDLMIAALDALGVTCQESDDPTVVTIIPPADGVFMGDTRVYCGLAGTVMRFVPALAMYANGPVHFDGDEQAYKRPMKPVLDGLEQMGAKVEYHGVQGFLPFTITPPMLGEQAEEITDITIDSSQSSQFISGLLLAASRWNRSVTITHAGESVPSMPHIRMTMHDLEQAGVHIIHTDMTWTVTPHSVQLPHIVVVEPDLSNAAPFLGAALIAGGQVRVPRWPAHSTQPGALLPEFLRDLGATVQYDPSTLVLSVSGDGHIKGLGQYDLSAAGEIAPSLAALATLAESDSTFIGISHLRGHETDRLYALSTEINRCGGQANETDDGIEIHAVPRENFHGSVMQTYADHRMATFAAMIGLAVSGIEVVDVQTTRKTIPNFVDMWNSMLGTSAYEEN